MLQKIGFFDSGIGGISVLNEALKLLPNESFIYVADSKHAPYGNKDADFIYNRSFAIVNFLLSQKVKAVVIACNTATAYAIQKLRCQFSLPIIGVEPAIKPALKYSQNIAVMATTKTLLSDKYQNLVSKQMGKVIPVPCPNLVEEIEKGFIKNNNIKPILQDLLIPILEKKIDTLVLGCTHYSLIKTMIEEVVGSKIKVIDANMSVSKRLKTILLENNLQNIDRHHEIKYYSNANHDLFKKIFKINSSIYTFTQ